MLGYKKAFVDLMALFAVLVIGFGILNILAFVNKAKILTIEGDLRVFLNLNTRGSSLLAVFSEERDRVSGLKAIGLVSNKKFKERLKDTLNIVYGVNNYYFSLTEKNNVIATFGEKKGKGDAVKGLRLSWPLKGDIEITSGYGLRLLPSGYQEFHKGVDLRCDGDAVYAPLEGVVVSVEKGCVDNNVNCLVKRRTEWGNHPCTCNAGYGNNIKIKHYIEGYGDVYTVYHHLREIMVREREKVNKNTIIGICGNTGYSSGPHLHFGLLDKNNNPLNPCLYLPSSPANCERAMQPAVDKQIEIYEFSIPLPGGRKGEVLIA